jgi:hypothetical protein
LVCSYSFVVYNILIWTTVSAFVISFWNWGLLAETFLALGAAPALLSGNNDLSVSSLVDHRHVLDTGDKLNRFFICC